MPTPPPLELPPQSTPIRPKDPANNLQGITTETRRALADQGDSETARTLCDFLPPIPGGVTQDGLDDIAKLIKSNVSEVVNYWKILLLLNSLSEMVLKSARSEFAIGYVTSHSRTLDGDFLDTQEQPDFVGYKMPLKHFFQLLDTLRERHKLHLSDPSNNTPPPIIHPPPFWGFGSTTGEDKRRLRPTAQGRMYCDTLRRYRPDLPDVFGFMLVGQTYELYSSGCNGPCATDAIPLSDLGPFSRYITAVYQAENYARENQLKLVPYANRAGQSWKITLPAGLQMDIAPFFAGNPRGRSTWVGIETPLMNHLVKVYWHDTQRRNREYELYERLHSGGWVDGVARLAHYSLADAAFSSRRQTTIILKSVGDPLSMCKSLYHFLCVMYDLVEAHQHMCEKGVLHRDISWYNVMCNPRHLDEPANSQLLILRPCIAKVLNPRDNDARSQVLIIDLDHAAEYPDPGTPMFIAIDVATGGSRKGYREPIAVIPALCDFVERLLNATPLLPESDMQDVKQTVEILRDHRASGHQASDGQHEPRHDVESMFWIMLWHLVRADDPRDPDKDAIANVTYQRFCEQMMRHTIGVNTENDRLVYRGGSDPGGLTDMLHQPFQFLDPVLCYMGIYLAVDWRQVQAELPKFHAHKFMKVLLLSLITSPNTNGVELSSRPRVFNSASLRKEGTPASSIHGHRSGSKRSGSYGESNQPKKKQRRESSGQASPRQDGTVGEDLIKGAVGQSRTMEGGKFLLSAQEVSAPSDFFFGVSKGDPPSEAVDEFRKQQHSGRYQWFGRGI